MADRPAAVRRVVPEHIPELRLRRVVVAAFRPHERDRQRLKRRAAPERPVADVLDIVGNHERLDAPAVQESILPDVRHRRGDGNVRHAVAVLERVVADHLDSFGNDDLAQRRLAPAECRIANRLQARRERRKRLGGKALAVLERIRADRSHAISHRDVH